MKKSLLLFATITVLMLAGVPVRAATPNLSGEWKLNLAKSDYEKFPVPESVARKIEHNGSKLVLTTTQKGSQGEVTSKLVYTTDGKESVNEMAGGQSKGTAQWIGDVLIIESSREFQGVTLKQKEVWIVSPDNRTLTIDSHVTIPNGDFDVKQVFEKQ
ncbi:MAG: hypothetical protein ABI833_12535 [Acidobacteriota bacterium]